MAYTLTLDEMIDEMVANLDTDPTYWMENEGVVSFGVEKIHYVRLPDEFKLTVAGATMYVPRP